MYSIFPLLFYWCLLLLSFSAQCKFISRPYNLPCQKYRIKNHPKSSISALYIIQIYAKFLNGYFSPAENPGKMKFFLKKIKPLPKPPCRILQGLFLHSIKKILFFYFSESPQILSLCTTGTFNLFTAFFTFRLKKQKLITNWNFLINEFYKQSQKI